MASLSYLGLFFRRSGVEGFSSSPLWGSVSSSFLFLVTQALVKGSLPNRTTLVARGNSHMSRKSNHVVIVLRTTSEVVLQFVLLYPSRPTRQVQMKMFLSMSVCAHSFPLARLRRFLFVQKAEQFNTKCEVERLIMSERTPVMFQNNKGPLTAPRRLP